MTQIFIIFSSNNLESIPSLGNYLGDLTDELACKNIGCKKENCEGHWIVEFISCGPKNYSYKLNTGQVICKVRGFSLNFSGSQINNFDSMKETLMSWLKNDETKLVTIKTEIKRNKYESKVYSSIVKKHYGVVYDKRSVYDDYTTKPYGFKAK